MMINLHSTMYLLKRLPSRHFLYMLYHLHSTMYLLKRSTDDYIKQPEENLHSTMYLLKRKCVPILSSVTKIYIPLCIY